MLLIIVIPKCQDPIEIDEYCMLGVKGYGIASKLKSTCLKQCKYKVSNLETMELEQGHLYPLGKYTNGLYIHFTFHGLILYGQQKHSGFSDLGENF